jgi:hypothetical protein
VREQSPVVPDGSSVSVIRRETTATGTFGPIEKHGITGNRRTSVLISPDGPIESICATIGDETTFPFPHDRGSNTRQHAIL